MERVGELNTRPQDTVLDDRIWSEMGILADRIIYVRVYAKQLIVRKPLPVMVSLSLGHSSFASRTSTDRHPRLENDVIAELSRLVLRWVGPSLDWLNAS